MSKQGKTRSPASPVDRQPLRVLVVEDSPADAELMQHELTKAGFEVTAHVVQTAEEVVERLREESYDVVLSDYRLPGWNGMGVFELVRQEGHGEPVILVSGMLGEELAVECVKRGVADYVLKGQLARLQVAVERALEEREAQLARARAEAALLENQERLLKAQRVARMGFLDRNLITNEMYWSDAVYWLYGVDPEQQTATLDLTMKLVHPEDREYAGEQIELATQGVKKYDIDHRILRPDGEVIWVHAQAELVRDTAGRPASLLGTVVDITKRKQAEQALKDSEERLKILFESAPDAYYLYDLTGTILDGNRSAEELTGYRREELIGENLLALGLISPDQLPRVMATLERNALGLPTGPEEFVLTRKDGSPVTIETRTFPVSIKDERLVLASARDISQRKQAEADRARLSMVTEQTGDSVIITATDGTIQYVNAAFTQGSGYSRAEAVGQNPRILRSGKHDASFYREMWNALVQGESWRRTFINKRKDGTLYEIDQTFFPISDTAGNPLNYVAIGRDLTTQRALEAQLHQAQKLEALGRLAGGVAHDFNNILTAILGTGDLMLNTMEPDDAHRTDIEEIMKAGYRAASLTHQLLAFGRQQMLESQVLDLNALVTDIETMLRRLIGEDIELRAVLAPGLGAVRADPGQLEQVIMNLAVNARDAMPQGGRLTIETAHQELNAEDAHSLMSMRPGPYVVLTVSDTGVGMDAETRAYLFEPFFTTKARGKGTGLGLATVYGIIQQSDGYIWVHSEPGQGTTFKVYLPRLDAVAGQSAKRDTGPPVSLRGSETILIAEDEAPVLRLIERILKTNGYSVLTALNGIEALQMARGHAGPINLLLTDVVMPGMSGRELGEQIGAGRPDIKVLYMSGYTDDAVFRHGAVGSGVAFLQKPFTPEGLASKVRAVLTTP